MNNAANWNCPAGDQSLLRIGRNGAEAGLGDDGQNDCPSPTHERCPNWLILDGSDRRRRKIGASDPHRGAGRIASRRREELVRTGVGADPMRSCTLALVALSLSGTTGSWREPAMAMLPRSSASH